MGERIRGLRMALGMTQGDLAEKMNVTDKAVSKWERGLSRPDIDSLPKLAETLGTTVQELCGESAQKQNSRAEEILGIALLGIGMSSLALHLLQARKSGQK